MPDRERPRRYEFVATDSGSRRYFEAAARWDQERIAELEAERDRSIKYLLHATALARPPSTAPSKLVAMAAIAAQHAKVIHDGMHEAVNKMTKALTRAKTAEAANAILTAQLETAREGLTACRQVADGACDGLSRNEGIELRSILVRTLAKIAILGTAEAVVTEPCSPTNPCRGHDVGTAEPHCEYGHPISDWTDSRCPTCGGAAQDGVTTVVCDNPNCHRERMHGPQCASPGCGACQWDSRHDPGRGHMFVWLKPCSPEPDAAAAPMTPEMLELMDALKASTRRAARARTPQDAKEGRDGE